MKFFSFFSIIPVIITVLGCSPRIVANISDPQPTLEYSEEVSLELIGAAPPDSARLIGTIKVGESGFTTKCNLDHVINLAKLEARKYGGNLIIIVDHKPPDIISSCHRIVVEVYRIN